MNMGPYYVKTDAGELLAYLRAHRSEPMTVQIFGPKPEDHPSLILRCPSCLQGFQPGDFTTLAPLGPGDSPENREKCQEGRWYNAAAIEVHLSCYTGLDLTNLILESEN